MAKKHYIIEAKGPECILGNKITIEDCTDCRQSPRLFAGDFAVLKRRKVVFSRLFSLFLV